MARIERVVRVCDLHDGEADASRALFVIDSRIYEVDACPAHSAELRAGKGPGWLRTKVLPHPRSR
jgi:hypothetical protein